MHEFVTPVDEAFAMLAIENNVAKWMSEICFPTAIIPVLNTIYTRKKWSKMDKKGQRRFINQFKLIRKFRTNNNTKDKYREIAELVLRREQSLFGSECIVLNNSYDEDNDNSSDDNDEEEEMEKEFLALANGE